ncbi:AcrR family transcriptional regulator [Rhizobium sp. BK313]|uniref:TetR-like C-terminal domain-containing protein n=1 Tax=Rhizobium sp. BK313 TaxID=2587081 RepID=UPI00105C3210|nr:TetR-like C-terminal domain-containing protein [Rhizobium sp. BK313]MBB3456816.1 AcrR family transcriptional regulator [Rhizobium sp. BK313]
MVHEVADVVSRRPYHHGDLKAALLAEAAIILEKEGIQALTLRAAARAAGVSHAAPKNHFGDLTGLLSELAALGFVRFGAALADAMAEAGDDPRQRIKAMGRGYVGFAAAHPGLFALMFRSEALDHDRPALRDAVLNARQALAAAVRARTPDKTMEPLQMAAQATALWSLVHGFAMLLLEGRLNGMIRPLPGNETADTLLDAVLAAIHVGD